jgi:hypothetical protein
MRNFRGSNGLGNVNFVGGQPNIANLQDLNNFQVNWNQWELTNQSLYDSAAYPAAGLASLAFFQVPVGQGTGFGGGAKTLSDTNMRLAGSLSAGAMFIISSIEIMFQPTTPTVAAGMPAAFGAQAAAVQVNDAFIFGRSGNVTLQILAKNYLTEAPIGQFPPHSDFTVSGALSDTTTAAASSQSRIAFGNFEGNPYILTPNNLLLISNQNFSVTLAWPEGLQAITNPARVFVRLNGMQARKAQ